MSNGLPPLARLADHLIEDGLAEYIGRHRGEGRSWDWIARQLWADTDGEVDATKPTVRDWAHRLGVEPSPDPDEEAA